MTISFIKDYLKHRITAKNRHGLHSPFVYRLLDEVIYDFRATPVYDEIEDKKSRLLPNSRRRGNTRKVDQLLYRLARHFQPHNVVEIGTGMGISKRYLSKAAPSAQLISLEHDGSLRHATAKLGTVDFAFINYYSPADLFNCFELLLPKMGPDSLLVICNIYGSPLAKQNWQHVKQHYSVTATVDLFWLQLVFFREGMAKEHFKLKF
ncbi:O-methyltransferase [Mucilaginibacter paludis]|uniref:O-methyltransferase n=1 Tax=Mucilaginibacter paludis DSM 18603 TaxID=714943 RepID=H1Y1I4_9SPHI|nr:O-methyltransferase [Mucilaginibacter paludis]EHQ30858.1 O-methyltransferase [Mucilaginibacter paludis DSM 18603]